MSSFGTSLRSLRRKSLGRYRGKSGHSRSPPVLRTRTFPPKPAGARRCALREIQEFLGARPKAPKADRRDGRPGLAGPPVARPFLSGAPNLRGAPAKIAHGRPGEKQAEVDGQHRMARADVGWQNCWHHGDNEILCYPGLITVAISDFCGGSIA
jgi:hypothetical protein